MSQKRRKSVYRSFILSDHKGLEKLWYIVFTLLILVLIASGYLIVQIQDLSERIQNVPADGKMVNTSGYDDAGVNTNVSINNTNRTSTNTNASPESLAGMVYARVWSDEFVSELYNVSGSELRNVFSYLLPSSPFDIEGDELVYSSSNKDYTQWSIEFATFDGDARTLFKPEPKHAVTGGVRLPDGKIIFGTHCGFGCAPSEKEVVTMIYSLDPVSGKFTELFKETGKVQAFKVPAKILNDTTVILQPGYDATEGDLFVRNVYLLDVKTGEVQRLLLSDSAISYIPSPDGKSIFYTTFEYSLKPQKTTSRIVRKDLNGLETIIQESDVLEYRELVLAGSSDILALATSVESVEEGLGYFVLGPRTVRVIDLDTSQEKDVLNLVENNKQETITDLHAVVGDFLYYSFSKKTGSDTSFHRFNLKDKKDRVLIQEDRNIEVLVDD